MSVRKRGWKTGTGQFRQAFVVDYSDQSGKRRHRTFRLKGQADAFAATTRVQIGQGTHVPDSASVTVKAAGDLWLECARAANLEPGTIEQYEQHLRLHIAPFIGAEKLSRLTVPMM